MYNKSVCLKHLMVALITLMGTNLLKTSSSALENAAQHTKQTVNTTVYWHWGGDQDLQNINQDIQKNAIGIEKNFGLLNKLFESMKNMSEHLQTISLRLNALEAQQSLPGPKSCADILQNDVPDGVYTLNFDITALSQLRVYCAHDSDGGQAWTIIQRISNVNYSIFLNHKWDDYEHGFGDIAYDHWLGLKNIYKLQQKFGGSMELWIVKKYFNGSIKYAKYSNFSIESKSESYALKSKGLYSSSADFIDNFEHSLGHQFSTAYTNCAGDFIFNDGWWCKENGECCYGLNAKYADLSYIHMAIRPNLGN